MAFLKFESTSTRPNFLGSEIGLIQKTYEVKQEDGVADDSGRLYVKAGTVYPANDATAIGIVFEDIDVTDDAVRPASIIIAGRILLNRLPVEPAAAAVTAMTANGLHFDEMPDTVRDEVVTAPPSEPEPEPDPEGGNV